jgi:phosphotransferase system enzyme I (PtsP)
MAGHALDAMTLIGLGIRSLSMSPGNIGPVKMMIRSLNCSEITQYVGKLCERADHSLRARLISFAAERGVILK